MKILAINGSSRKDGNTADMLKLVLDELKKEGHETELLQLAGETINPCKACFACGGKGNCAHANDIFQSVFTKMREADAIILGTSTYSADVSSTLKAVIERASVVCDIDVVDFIHSQGIVVQAWYPLGGRCHQSELLKDPVLVRIAQAHDCSVAHVILRWHFQRHVVAIPGSSNPAHIAEDISIFDFALTDEEMAAIAKLDRKEKHDWY